MMLKAIFVREQTLNRFILNLHRISHIFSLPKTRRLRNVVHVSPTYFDEDSVIGGGERYATELAKAMARYVDTTLVALGREKKTEKRSELEIKVHPYLTLVDGSYMNPLSYSFLWDVLRADVIHCHQYRTVMTNMCILVGTILGKGVFVTDLGGGGRNYAEALGLGDRVDGFLLLSRFCRDTLFPQHAEKTTIIFGGVDGEKFSPGGERKRKVLFVGRLVPQKGINYLIEALDEATQLDIVGRAYDESYLRYLQSLSEGKRVRFITNASDEELVRMYRSASVTVLPSVYYDVYGEHYPWPELLGLTLLESMACETPVVCTSVGGMPEVVEDGVTGFVVPPNDPQSLGERIAYLLDNPEVVRRMGRAGRERVLRDFTWDAVARRCLKAYANIGSL
jgi:glycosyltransferase involved in cell wall biosynthesis